jgi:hypothetical protein
MSQHEEAHGSCSGGPAHDEDPETLAALHLPEQLDHGQSHSSGIVPSSQGIGYEEEAEWADALPLQSHQDGNSHSMDAFKAVSTSGFAHGEDSSRREHSSFALDEKDTKVANYCPETTTSIKFDTLTAFFAHVKAAQCSACSLPFFRSESDVHNMLEKWMGGEMALASSLTCSKCSTSSCIACTPQKSAKLSVVEVQGKQISWCCAGGRLLLLWLLLCGFDNHFSTAKAKEMMLSKSRKQAQAADPEWKISQHVALPHVSGLSSMAFPVEYVLAEDGGLNPYTSQINADIKARALSTQLSQDQFYGLYMQLIEGVLPSSERQSNFDLDPPNLIIDMLDESKVMQYCTELLRNDSLGDARSRIGVYRALFGLIRTLGSHDITTSMVYNKRSARDPSSNLLTSTFKGHSELPTEETPPLLLTLDNLNTQSQIVLQGAKSHEQEYQSHDGQQLLSLCHQILDLHGYLAAKSTTHGMGEANQSKVEIPAVADVPDDEIFALHGYYTKANNLSIAPPGRFKRLVAEITTLKTSLPPGIFVRYAASRLDVQKWIIIGPASTPYENGIFEFDVFCNADFPRGPPEVLFKTTGGGTVNFNPNLYQTGKVCLSLLGTWIGM